VPRLGVLDEAFARPYLVRHLFEDVEMLCFGIDLHKHSLVIHTVAEDGIPSGRRSRHGLARTDRLVREAVGLVARGRRVGELA
jgi:hypothetical protein